MAHVRTEAMVLVSRGSCAGSSTDTTFERCAPTLVLSGDASRRSVKQNCPIYENNIYCPNNPCLCHAIIIAMTFFLLIFCFLLLLFQCGIFIMSSFHFSPRDFYLCIFIDIR